MLFSVWQSEAGAYFQLTHFVFGIGGILSPLVAKPFMIRTIPSTLGQNITDGLANGSVSSVTMVTGWHVNFSEIKPGNWSMIPNTTRNIFDEPANLKETEVHVAYLITAVVAMSGALPFLLFFITGGRRELEKDETCSKNTKRVSNKIQVLVVTLLCIVSAVATALVDIFPSYLATFGLYQLHWSSGMGSSMTSLYFAMYAVGNFLGVFILKCISSKSFVILSYITSIGSIVIFYVGVRFAITPLQTIPIAATGLATSAILPTIFTWTQEAVTPISGMIASAFLFSGSVGAMLNPILLAYLMESVTPMSFLYLSILEAVFCFAIFIVAVLFISKFLIQDPYDVQISKSNSVVTMSNHLKEQVTKQRFRSEYYSKSTLIYF